MNKIEREVIIALADNRLNLTDAAAALYKNRNTLIFHVKKIQEKTGLYARDFHDMCKLYEMAINETES